MGPTGTVWCVFTFYPMSPVKRATMKNTATPMQTSMTKQMSLYRCVDNWNLRAFCTCTFASKVYSVALETCISILSIVSPCQCVRASVSSPARAQPA